MGSDGGDEFPCVVKKLKPHKKIFEDVSGVDGASVPRKLRSVIKKRTCHAISQPLTNLRNHVNGFDTTRKDCAKKPKSGAFNPEQMSKDEEEVAQTLYALAGTAPRKVTSLEKKSDSESPSGRQMHSKKLDDSLLSSQGPQTTPEEAAEETSNQTSEELSKLKVNVGDLGNSTPFSQPKLSQTIVQQNLNASLQVNHQSLAKTSLGTKMNDFEQREALPSQRVSENSYVIPQIVNVTSQDKRGHATTESKKNGSILMPTLYSQASHGSGGVDGFPSQFSSTKLPYWLRTVASSSVPDFHQSQASHKKEESVVNNNKRIKKSCPTHVYISRFIQLSQKAERKENSLLETHQFRPSEGVTLGVLKASSHLNPVSNESTPMVPDRHICSSFSEKNILNPSNDAIMMPGRSSHGQEQPSLAPGNSTLRKQCYDFLSLSTGGGGTEPKVEANRNGIQLNPLARLPVPHLQPLTRYDSVASLPLPPNLIPLNSYQNHRSTSAQSQPPIPQVHLQLPSYFSRSNPLDSSTASIAKQTQLQLQPPQQHSMWMTHSAAQYRVGTMAPPQIAHWQSSRQEPYIVQYTQAQTPPSLSSLAPGAQFPKYFQMPQQQHHQHQMLRIAPFPPVQANSQHSPVPICGDKIDS